MEDCTRSFPHVLILGGAGIQTLAALRGHAGVESAVLVDTSAGMLERARKTWQGWGPGSHAAVHAEFIQADQASEILPVEPASFDGEQQGLVLWESCALQKVPIFIY